MIGLLRSFFLYWRPGRQRSLRRLYARFVGEGDLVFDIGAHLGDRSVAFAALGARVVAVEPQPAIAIWLRRVVGRNRRITVRTEALGSTSGRARLAVSRRNPTVSTLSEVWRERVGQLNPGFRAVRWDDGVDVAVSTLDALIEEHGVPDFCKIDVEGFEAEVLAGLSRPVPGLSFEFVQGHLDAAVSCVERLISLGPYGFDVVVGEGRRFVFERWLDADAIVRWLDEGAQGASSGDIYARLLERDDGGAGTGA
jgi:FkbM family methyltransferase